MATTRVLEIARRLALPIPAPARAPSKKTKSSRGLKQGTLLTNKSKVYGTAKVEAGELWVVHDTWNDKFTAATLGNWDNPSTFAIKSWDTAFNKTKMPKKADNPAQYTLIKEHRKVLAQGASSHLQPTRKGANLSRSETPTP